MEQDLYGPLSTSAHRDSSVRVGAEEPLHLCCLTPLQHRLQRVQCLFPRINSRRAMRPWLTGLSRGRDLEECATIL